MLEDEWPLLGVIHLQGGSSSQNRAPVSAGVLVSHEIDDDIHAGAIMGHFADNIEDLGFLR